METVIKCEKVREWTNKQGEKVPIYKVEFSNGVTAESFAKEIPVNTDIEQCVFEDGKYGKNVKMKGQTSGRGNYQPKKQALNPATMCLSYAKDLVVAGKIDFDQLLPAADKMFTWVKGKED